MEQKIYLEKNRSTFSNNVENSIDVGFSTKTRFLSPADISKNVSMFEQYNEERNNCSRYRFIATINPICSNVLYNMKTEILYKEGSDECKVLNDDGNSWPASGKNSTNIDYEQAIKDTEYSHEECGDLTYHCGVNIFNNHLLRKNEFIHVNPIKNNSSVFNTISDYMRNKDGDEIKENISVLWDQRNVQKIHIYNADNILSMKNAFLSRCKEKDGWWGFYNPGTIEVPNYLEDKVRINRLLAKNKPCEFIDLYPDRSLFSFIPKYNKYRNRTEKNWDYCITYPYKNDSEMLKIVNGGEDKLDAIKATITLKHNSSGMQIAECISTLRHNLKRDDKIAIYYLNDDKYECLSDYLTVEDIGDANNEHRDNVFTLRYDDIISIYNNIKENDNTFYFKRVVSNTECSYYFRVLKKLEVTKSDINKVAFGQSIYGDNLAQLVFTEDIDIDELTDNLGRPVSEIFLTIVKRNAGYDKWYVNSQEGVNSEECEYSHCFGKVTSGIEFGESEFEPFDYNIHYLHNIDKNLDNTDRDKQNTIDAWGLVVSKGMPKVIEDDITIEQEEFYGDIVEFDPVNYIETTISNVCHRFNTGQRESFAERYKYILHDVITQDDYDVNTNDYNGFRVETHVLNDTMQTNRTKDKCPSSETFFGNIFPEGYYYKPHMKIKLREQDSTPTKIDAKYVNYGVFKRDGEKVTITSPADYGFLKGAPIALYDRDEKKIIWCELKDVNGCDLTFNIEGLNDDETINPNNRNRRYLVFWTNIQVPPYASFNVKTTEFIWRDTINNTEIERDSELYDIPFSNGRLYIFKNINFFLRRQDPFGKYGLSTPIFTKDVPAKVANQILNYSIQATKYPTLDISWDEFIKLFNCY